MTYFALVFFVIFLNCVNCICANEESDSILTFEVDTNLTDHKNYHLLPKEERCGQLGVAARISHGVNTHLNEFPWMALILAKTAKRKKFTPRCGGTVITKRYVLTAAHCVNDTKTKILVRLGEHNMRKKIDCEAGVCAPKPQHFLAEDIIIHPQYHNLSGANDIALIRLKRPTNFKKPNIKPICLPFENIQRNDLIGLGTVAGWGVTETGNKSSVLTKKSVFIHPLESCKKFFTRPITERQICARGYEGMNICKGDSGGPLQFITEFGYFKKYVQVGVISYGEQNCKSKNTSSPAVYSKVSYYMSWILDNLKP